MAAESHCSLSQTGWPERTRDSQILDVHIVHSFSLCTARYATTVRLRGASPSPADAPPPAKGLVLSGTRVATPQQHNPWRGLSVASVRRKNAEAGAAPAAAGRAPRAGLWRHSSCRSYPAARDCAARAALAAAMCLAGECSQRSCYKSRTFGHNPTAKRQRIGQNILQLHTDLKL